MRQTDFGREAVRRWLLDFAVVMALFWAFPYLFHASHNHAHAVPAPSRTTVVHDNVLVQAQAWNGQKIRLPGEVRAARTRSMILLSIAVAALAAFNLAFLRHLRRVYASPRRGVWRRG
jgi:hypothetical protein